MSVIAIPNFVMNVLVTINCVLDAVLLFARTAGIFTYVKIAIKGIVKTAAIAITVPSAFQMCNGARCPFVVGDSK